MGSMEQAERLKLVEKLQAQGMSPGTAETLASFHGSQACPALERWDAKLVENPQKRSKNKEEESCA